MIKLAVGNEVKFIGEYFEGKHGIVKRIVGYGNSPDDTIIVQVRATLLERFTLPRSYHVAVEYRMAGLSQWIYGGARPTSMQSELINVSVPRNKLRLVK